jgi:hypothetical protein
MDKNSPLYVTHPASLLQKGYADDIEAQAAAEALAAHPGYTLAQVRWCSAEPFDRSLGGRWVYLKVDLVQIPGT